MSRYLTLTLLVTAVSLSTARARAQDDVATGRVVGTVTLAETALPRLKTLHPHDIVKDGSVCGEHAPNEALVVGKDRRLANVVVSVRGVPAANTNQSARKPPLEGTLDQQKCRYVPHVQALAAPATLTVINSDAVFHNVNARLIGTSNNTPVFNVPTPFKGHRLKQKLKKPGVVHVRCDAGHTWMGAWVVLFEHPHFAITDQNGDFTIPDLPSGTWKLEFWHEPLPGQSGTGVVHAREVTVTASKDTRADYTFGF